MSSIGTVETGTVGELYVFTELLRRGATVYTPIADVTGIDAVVRSKSGQLKEVQVKTHSTDYMAGWFDVPDLDKHQLDRFVVVGIDMREFPPHEVWVIPGEVFVEYATLPSSRQGYTVHRLDLDARSRKHGNELRRNILAPHFCNAWSLLTD